MKTKEELLKIYSAYLPYELQLENKSYKYERFKTLTPFEFLKDDHITEVSNDFWPILYSMDMLTKEIDHKGEKFVPSDKIQVLRDFDNIAYMIKIGLILYSDMQKLIEWHFNVFGLDELEYIKKQSVIQK